MQNYRLFVCVGLVDSEAVFGDKHLSTLFTDEPGLPLVHCIHMTNQPLGGFITFLTDWTLFVFRQLTNFNMSLKYPVVVKFLLALFTPSFLAYAVIIILMDFQYPKVITGEVTFVYTAECPMLFKMDLSEMYCPVLFRGKVFFTRTTLKSYSSVYITMIVPIIFSVCGVFTEVIVKSFTSNS